MKNNRRFREMAGGGVTKLFFPAVWIGELLIESLVSPGAVVRIIKLLEVVELACNR